MKLFSFLAWSCLAAHSASALDPFHPPDEWEKYQQHILKDRPHEKPVWVRPAPGESPVVAIQTLILPEFQITNASPDLAFDAWQDACFQNGVNVKVYLDPAVLRHRPVITHSAKGENAARALSFIESVSGARVRLVNDHFLVGVPNSLDPRELHFRVWILSEPAVRILELPGPSSSGATWTAAENRLDELGATFPAGTYADFHRELRALVVVNTRVTTDAIAELIRETEAHATVRSFMNKGAVQMEGYSLEVRSHPLRKENAFRIAARLRDDHGRLVPFAVSAETWARSRGFSMPLGGAVWLDLESSSLWLRSSPDLLDQFAEVLKKAELSE